ncbi:hypothetical protein D3248_04320 [Leucobacter zeae]|nr:hypothetical protein [Leucobacter zeae]
MASLDFYSDRNGSAPPRDQDELPDATRRGLLNLVQSKIDGDWFAQRFPEQCLDGNGVCGTNVEALTVDLQALIPELGYPLLTSDGSADEAVFDLLEYAAQRLSLPEQDGWHSFYRHYELKFDQKKGRRSFREEVNQMLSRGRATFEMDDALQIQRFGTPEVRGVLADLNPDTGDAALDKLIVDSRALFLSYREDDRKLGLEKLWDAFERLKTIELPGNKKASAQQLLAHINDEPFRELLEAEMRALTNIGNGFNLRHHETDKHQVPTEAYDYLYSRMGGLMITLLRESGRLA